MLKVVYFYVANKRKILNFFTIWVDLVGDLGYLLRTEVLINKKKTFYTQMSTYELVFQIK